MTTTPAEKTPGLVSVAQIGCGYWGPNLLRNLSQSRYARVAGVAEASEERRAYVAATYPGTPVFDSASDVIENDEIDAVVIATPAATHGDLVRRALLNNKHVLVEKPLCFTEEEGTDLITLARERGRVIVIGHVYLYHAYVIHARDLLRQGAFGRPVYFHSSRLNLGIARSDVNAWWNLAPHDVAVLLYWRDGIVPVEISATGIAHLQPDVEDVVFATLRWADGVSAQIHVSWLEPEKVRRTTLVGSQKMAVFNDLSENPLAIYDKGIDVVPVPGGRMDYDTPRSVPFVHRDGEIDRPKLEFPEPLAAEIDDFLCSIIENRTPVASAQHALDVTRILACGQESMNAGGRAVRIDANE